MALADLQRRHGQRLAATFGEQVTYTRKADPGNPLTLQAIVRRDPLMRQSEDGGRTVAAPIELFIAAADLDAIDTDGDTVTLKRRLDDPAASRMRVSAVLAQDAHGWRLAVGR